MSKQKLAEIYDYSSGTSRPSKPWQTPFRMSGRSSDLAEIEGDARAAATAVCARLALRPASTKK